MLDALDHAIRYPEIWHKVGDDTAMREAVQRLAFSGVVEVNSVSNQYRLKAS
jgi:hypothetical protein